VTGSLLVDLGSAAPAPISGWPLGCGALIWQQELERIACHRHLDLEQIQIGVGLRLEDVIDVKRVTTPPVEAIDGLKVLTDFIHSRVLAAIGLEGESLPGRSGGSGGLRDRHLEVDQSHRKIAKRLAERKPRTVFVALQ